MCDIDMLELKFISDYLVLHFDKEFHARLSDLNISHQVILNVVASPTPTTTSENKTSSKRERQS